MVPPRRLARRCRVRSPSGCEKGSRRPAPGCSRMVLEQQMLSGAGSCGRLDVPARRGLVVVDEPISRDEPAAGGVIAVSPGHVEARPSTARRPPRCLGERGMRVDGVLDVLHSRLQGVRRAPSAIRSVACGRGGIEQSPTLLATTLMKPSGRRRSPRSRSRRRKGPTFPRGLLLAAPR